MFKRTGALVAAVIIAAVCVTFIGVDAFAKEYKIGYVDLAKVSDEYAKTKDFEKTFEVQVKAKDSERQKFVDEIRKLKDAQALLSDKAKAEKQAIIDGKITNLQEFDRKVRDELIKQRNQMLGEIQKDIDTVISAYSKEAGYDVVLIKQTVLFADSDLDLTTEVVKRLNAAKR
ncbi:MAG: OmpH family outer membrane protein, partial [Candidatus Omnitrophota bacterium]|jgi:Skp family chaperone for outer membrane proteins|nr:OmpH family outer membrane protein [Candidatus Omnitrophota bacterium]